MAEVVPDKGKGPGRGAGRWLRVALGLSLALNLAVAGVVGGALLRGGGHGPHPSVRDLGFGPFAEALSEADRAALRRAFVGRMPDLRATRDEMRADMGAILTALRADPYDPSALLPVLERQRARTGERLELGQALIVDRIAAMTAAERLAFADRLEQSLRHRRGGRPRD